MSINNNAHSSVTLTILDQSDTFSLNVPSGSRLMDVLRSNGIPVTAPCGGKGTCKKCSVEIEGEGSVLACAYRVTHAITARMPHQAHAVILADSKHSRSIVRDSGLIKNTVGDMARFTYKKKHLFSLPASYTGNEGPLGIAVDIGTTTVVVFLVNLTSYEIVGVSSFINPQTAYGHDVISRITVCIETAEGLPQLQSAIISRINSSVASLCRSIAANTGQICLATIVGNTTMLHLFCGVNPSSIAFAPFTPVFTEEKSLRAETLGLHILPNAVVRVLPSISGYVGADIVAGIASTTFADQSEFSLYIDIGTNGEMALGNKEIMYCCATATGPAFEGANIQCGIGGVEGAIAQFESDGYVTIGHVPPVGICGSGLVDIVAYLIGQGRVDAAGFMEHEFLVASKNETGTGADIVLTPQDVRQVQLAKAAVSAGIKILMKEAGVPFDKIKNVYLAGGFGNYIRVESAVAIGLLPPQLQDKIIPIGNGAGCGSRFALESDDFNNEINKVLDLANYIELSSRMDFNEEYVMAMGF